LGDAKREWKRQGGQNSPLNDTGGTKESCSGTSLKRTAERERVSRALGAKKEGKDQKGWNSLNLNWGEGLLTLDSRLAQRRTQD